MGVGEDKHLFSSLIGQHNLVANCNRQRPAKFLSRKTDQESPKHLSKSCHLDEPGNFFASYFSRKDLNIWFAGKMEDYPVLGDDTESKRACCS